MDTQEKEFKGFRLSGFFMILIQIIIIAAMIFVGYRFENNEGLVIALEMVLFTILIFSLIGFVMIEPNEARVMIFFGKYKGTLKQNGFFWVNPFYVKKKLVIRARNLDIEPIKVNDKAGNPVMIGLVNVAFWFKRRYFKAPSL
jgi:regulator of protease activity HflC (stomatin/prohibitin superfamily)